MMKLFNKPFKRLTETDQGNPIVEALEWLGLSIFELLAIGVLVVLVVGLAVYSSV